MFTVYTAAFVMTPLIAPLAQLLIDEIRGLLMSIVPALDEPSTSVGPQHQHDMIRNVARNNIFEVESEFPLHPARRFVGTPVAR